MIILCDTVQSSVIYILYVPGLPKSPCTSSCTSDPSSLAVIIDGEK